MSQKIETKFQSKKLGPLTWHELRQQTAVVYTSSKNKVGDEGIDFWFRISLDGKPYMVHPTGEVCFIRDSGEYCQFLVASPGDSVTITVKEA